MNEIIFVVKEPPEGGYAAEALGHAIFTVAGTLDELNLMVRDAVVCHFEDAAGSSACISFAMTKPPGRRVVTLASR